MAKWTITCLEEAEDLINGCCFFGTGGGGRGDIGLDLFKKAGFDDINQINIDHAYDRFIIGEGKYPLLMFVCSKHNSNNNLRLNVKAKT